MRVAFAVSVATVICATAPAYAEAQGHVQAAKRAEKHGQWRKALAEWKAAYNSDVNAEYLVGIGDAYAHLGNKAQARKNYEAYLADPLALPATAEKVKVKVASLDGGAGATLALPGPGLDLPAPPALGLPDGSPGDARRGKKKKVADAAPLGLPGMDLPGATAQNQQPPDPNALTLPGMDLPPPSKPVASNTFDLPPPPSTIAKPPAPGVATTQPATPPGRVIASTTPTTKPVATTTTTRVPDAALGQGPRPQPEASSGGTRRVVAYVAAGVAVLALGGGAFAYAKASSASSDLTGSKHSSADAQTLLSNEKSDKTLSFVGLAGGLLAGGVSAALFAF
jgi:hypothetical protein